MNLKESIKRILKEETQIPSIIRRRVPVKDIEKAFKFSLDDNFRWFSNHDTSIEFDAFAKNVIDGMITLIEQEYFNDDTRIYFDDDNFYFEEIRNPLIKQYYHRIKARHNKIK
jgi:hypothetical protein